MTYHTAWHPPDEDAAPGAMTVFVEWLRACDRRPVADPDDVRRWAIRDRAAFLSAIADFAFPERGPSPAAVLLRPRGGREALVLHRDGRHVWSGDAVRASTPPQIAAVLARLTWEDLAGLAAGHLLDANTCPDDRKLWLGPLDDPWPLGVWIAGATLILADRHADAAALAAAERATLLRPRPSTQGAG